MVTLQQYQGFLEQRNLLECILVPDLETIQFDSDLFRKDGVAHLDDGFQHSSVEWILVSCRSLVLVYVLSGSPSVFKRGLPKRYLGEISIIVKQ
jgi:hypothetical protein